MMKRLLSLLFVGWSLVPGLVFAEEKQKAKEPAVEVYLIRKMETKSPEVVARPLLLKMSAAIMEISNPTDRTYYVHGVCVERPAYDIEVKRGEKWLAKPAYECGEGAESFPLKPGAKMLVTVDPPLDEPVLRFRFYFFTTDDEKTARVVTVRSREIEAKEIHDMERIDKKVPVSTEGYEELRTDEEMNVLLKDQQK